ncbi:unnamed protein product, partial [Ectocarpus sp. 12 AP-2014]
PLCFRLGVTPPNRNSFGLLIAAPLLPLEPSSPRLLPGGARSAGAPSAPHPRSASPAVESFGGRSAAVVGTILFLKNGVDDIVVAAAAAEAVADGLYFSDSTGPPPLRADPPAVPEAVTSSSRGSGGGTLTPTAPSTPPRRMSPARGCGGGKLPATELGSGRT